MSEPRAAYDEDFLNDCKRIHQQWHERAKSRDTEGLFALSRERQRTNERQRPLLAQSRHPLCSQPRLLLG